MRARFFQQLSDRGAVDEFEVQWRAEAEPTWAVLSARRVSFQGQDAVLTTFTPINHLKLMERRLELWAKVFEASSEGILIIDGAQQDPHRQPGPFAAAPATTCRKWWARSPSLLLFDRARWAAWRSCGTSSTRAAPGRASCWCGDATATSTRPG